MSRPIAPAGAMATPSVSPIQKKMQWGANALTAPTTPEKRIPVIDKDRVPPQIKKAAEGMEAMFIDYLMQTMRKSIPKNDVMPDSFATEIYQGLFDTEAAERAAHAGGVGLADQIIAYLGAAGYNLEEREVPLAKEAAVNESPKSK